MTTLHSTHSIEYLSEMLFYCPETGIFTWKKKPSIRLAAGAVAGKKCTDGYVTIELHRKCYMAHRLAWALHFGEWPSLEIDHVNRVRDDNRIANLRQATKSQNGANRTMNKKNRHGAKGITQLKYGKWQAQIGVNGANYYLGSFAEKEDAIAAYAAASKKFFGEFACAGAQP